MMFIAAGTTTPRVAIVNARWGLANSGVPGITGLWASGSQPFTEWLGVVSHGQPRDVLHALVSKLTGHAQAKRSAVPRRKLCAVHSVSDESLWMQRVVHIDAVPPKRLDGGVHHILRPRGHSGDI